MAAIRARARGVAAARVELPYRTAAGSSTLATDAAATERAAVGLGRGWRAEYERGLLSGLGEREAQAAATDTVAGHYAARTALTEASSALNDEVARLARAEEAATGKPVWLRWSAFLDRRTCSTCEALDGEERRASEGFEEGPPAHASCRCFVYAV